MPYRCIPDISADGQMRGTFLPMTDRNGDVPGYWPHALFRDGSVVAMHKSVGKNYTGEGELEKLVALAWSIQQAGIATVEYAGQIKEYSSAIIQMRLGEETLIQGDRYVNNLQIGTSFVGEESFYVTMSARRFWCSNERPTINRSQVVKRRHRRIEGQWTVSDIAQEISMLSVQHNKYFKTLGRMHQTVASPNDVRRWKDELFGPVPLNTDPRFRNIDGTVNERKFLSAVTRRERNIFSWNSAYESPANTAVWGTVAGLYEATLQDLQYATDGKGRSKHNGLAAITAAPTFVTKERKAFRLAEYLSTASV